MENEMTSLKLSKKILGRINRIKYMTGKRTQEEVLVMLMDGFTKVYSEDQE